MHMFKLPLENTKFSSQIQAAAAALRKILCTGHVRFSLSTVWPSDFVDASNNIFCILCSELLLYNYMYKHYNEKLDYRNAHLSDTILVCALW